MVFQLGRPNPLYCCVYLTVLSLSWCNFASGQTEPCTTEAVPNGLEGVSAILGVCQQVAEIANVQPMDHHALAAETQDKLKEIQQAAAAKSATINAAIAEANPVERFATDYFVEQTAKDKRRNDRLLKYSGIIIGGVGAVAGGGLRLVNDKTVMHDGTVVSMVGGGVGALINLFVTSKQPNPSEEATTEIQEMLPPLVKTYIKASNNNFDFATILTKPSSLSWYLLEMRRQTNCVQNKSPEAWAECAQRPQPQR